ncbi:MAG: hypothetical protein CMN25_08525 [Salinicola sp.]|uniref:gp53-like domain-containing protein n=1 Tax=uncultured Salinicola sp. TaxID=1193542 RepID=UPI000C951BE0|nr:hypothetical protein [uncultured Salinicola sp.]MAM57364.1 hypothetical protein [Salinicola sp.]
MAIRFIVTDAGRAALTNEDNTGTGARKIAEIGLGRGQYTASDRSRTDLVDPIKRINTIGGETVAPDIIHVTLQDETSDTYSVGEIGLFLDNGVLFAYYSQPDDWIIEKAAPATLLLATDIELADIDVSSLTFGDAAFLNPPATETVLGVIEIATQEEVDAGTDRRRAVVPRTLKAMLDKVLKAYATVKQLADHAASRDHPGATTSAQGMVELATYGETQAGEDNSRAVTPAALNSRTATTSRTGLVEQATETEAKAGAANVFPDAAGVVAAFQQYGLGVQALPNWPLASFNDNPLSVPSGLYRLTSTTDGTPQGSGCIIWTRYNSSQYGTAIFMPYSGRTIYTRSYRFDTEWSAWVMSLDEDNHRAATNSQAVAGTATDVWASPSSIAAHVQSLGWGATAPEIGALFDNDFDKWVNQDIVGTVSGDWKNGPYGNSAHTGVLMQLARTYNNGIAQLYFDTSRGESFYRCNTGSSSRPWQKQLTDQNLREATAEESTAGDSGSTYLSPRRGYQLIQNFGLGSLLCPDWPLDDLNADPTAVRSGLYRITSNFNRPGGAAVVLWTRYNLSTGSMLLIEQSSGAVRNRGYGSGSWSDWATAWNEDNDGPGSGLDADQVDGLHASQFLRSDIGNARIPLGSTSASNWDGIVWEDSSDTLSIFMDQDPENDRAYVVIGKGYVEINGKKVWHPGNQGHGTGMDADTVDGKHASDLVQLKPGQSQTINAALEVVDNGNAANDKNYGVILSAFAPGVGFVDRSTNGGGGVIYFDQQTFRVAVSASDTNGTAAGRSDKTELITLDSNVFRYRGNDVWHHGNVTTQGGKSSGRRKLPNGDTEMWGYVTTNTSESSPTNVTFPYSFDSECYNVSITPVVNPNVDVILGVNDSPSRTGFTAYASRQSESSDSSVPGFFWRAVGR